MKAIGLSPPSGKDWTPTVTAFSVLLPTKSCASVVSQLETNGVANGMSYGVHFELDYAAAMIDSGRGMVESTYGKKYLEPRKSCLGSSDYEFFCYSMFLCFDSC
ncbi:hypothetical protein CMV_000330 [Castanea mollissima]|uniref:Uncharacterized protein n=1 Tax=Castanea mollissima TaxID=60419 RepID=A0A8J4RMP2_9ROSI|nr:hypothetical protein CMV_000330 [Castanea mollissima]